MLDILVPLLTDTQTRLRLLKQQAIMHAYIFNIQRFCIHDGPGIRTTVFFQGCPLQCLWCHNPEGIPYDLSLGITDKHTHQYTVEELMAELMKDEVFYRESGGGITFSGGEPMMQADFLLRMLNLLARAGIHTAVDTSGYAPPDIFHEVVSHAGLILFDLKIIDEQKHELYTSTGNELIMDNLRYLARSRIPYRIRIPLVEDVTASDENIRAIAELLKDKGKVNIDLLSYHDLGKGKASSNERTQSRNLVLKAPSPERIKDIRSYLESYNYIVSTGG